MLGCKLYHLFCRKADKVAGRLWLGRDIFILSDRTQSDREEWELAVLTFLGEKKQIFQ